MFFPKTGELETFWTNYTCIEEDCPGKLHVRKRTARGDKAHPWNREFKRNKEVQAWLVEKNRDSPTYTKHSPHYGNDKKPHDGLGWDDPDTGKPGDLY